MKGRCCSFLYGLFSLHLQGMVLQTQKYTVTLYSNSSQILYCLSSFLSGNAKNYRFVAWLDITENNSRLHKFKKQELSKVAKTLNRISLLLKTGGYCLMFFLQVSYQKVSWNPELFEVFLLGPLSSNLTRDIDSESRFTA